MAPLIDSCPSLADLFIPDQVEIERALGRTTHLAIGAHQDDLEIMAYHGIAACYGESDLWFCGVVCTDGRGSSRIGPYRSYSDEEMVKVRREEQRQAAMVGKYGSMLQFGFSSPDVREEKNPTLAEELKTIFELTRPKTVYTHNPADKHHTHIAVLKASIDAMRMLPRELQPEKVYGCEVWRDLDWMHDQDKIALDVSHRENLANALVGIFDSQITGGKRYDLAAMGRRHANATFYYPDVSDGSNQVTFAMDLSPLIRDPSLSVLDFTLVHIDRFRDDVKTLVSRWF